MIKRALIVDTETTGLDPKKDRVIEVACILYDLELARPIASYATLIESKSNEGEAVNHIPVSLLKDAPDLMSVRDILDVEYYYRADVILAHNAAFDRSFLTWFTKPWICTMDHFEWPRPCASKSLAAIALAHDVGIVQAHRALADCDIIARLLTRVSEISIDLPTLIARAMRPRQKVVALVPYEKKDLAKQAGFTWDTERKIWWREDFVDNAGKYPFKVRVVKQ